MPWNSKEKHNEYMGIWRERQYKKRDEAFGKICALCKSERSLILHRKDGKPHTQDSSRLVSVALKNPEKWCRLCYSCHKGIHWCMKYIGWNWEEIISHMK